MKFKVFLSLGNEKLEEKFKTFEELEIIDTESDLKVLKELIPHLSVNYIIINTLLDSCGDEILEVAGVAKQYGIKVIALINDCENTQTKKNIAALVNKDVNAYVELSQIEEHKILDIMESYPKEFDFNILGKQEIKIIEKERVIKEEVIKAKVLRNNTIVCYSPDSNVLSASVAANLAVKFSQIEELKTIVIDFNNINPYLDKLLCIEKNINMDDKYTFQETTSMKALVNSINRKVLTPQLFKDLVIRHPKYKLDIITGLYDLILDDKVTKDHYKTIIDMASEMYDVVIIATNSYMKNESTFVALTSASKVVFISQDNYSSVLNLMQQIVLLDKRIDTNKFNIVISKSENGLSGDFINEAFASYKFLGYIYSSLLIDQVINKNKIYLDLAGEEENKNYDKLLNKLGYCTTENKKTNFFSKILRKGR